MMLFDDAITNALTRRAIGRFEPRAALIDMDGTLYDSMPLHAKAWETMAIENGLKYEAGEFYMMEGATGSYTINRLMNDTFGRGATDDEVKSLYERKASLFRSYPEPPIMPGAESMLLTLKALGLRCVLVTGSGQKALLERIDRDFPGIFDAEMRVTARDVERGKPDPEPFLKAMEKAGVAPREAIAIENAPLGVLSASRSGAFTVGVTTGPLKHAALEESGADIVFGSMPEFAGAAFTLIERLRHVNL